MGRAHGARGIGLLLVVSGLLLIGCGGDDDSSPGKDNTEDGGGGKAGDDGDNGGGGSGGDNGSTGSPDGGGGSGGDGSGGTKGGAGGDTGGSGGDGSGGDGSGGTTGGSGGDTSDPCDGLTPCDKAQVSCVGDILVTCKKNADGCLVQTNKDCTMGDTDQCDPDADPPACVGDPCANLPNLCSTVGTTCNNDGITLVTCALNDDGCKVQTTTDCTDDGDNNYCKATGTAACAFDKCLDGDGQPKPNQCVEDSATCDGDVLITCDEDDDGCVVVKSSTPCDAGNTNYCKDGATDMCAFDYCIDEQDCLVAGKTCDGTKLIDCELNNHDCLATTTTDCKTEANPNFTCDVATKTCLACTDDVGCERANDKAEGDSVCDSNSLSTCTDTDHDGCLNKVTTACGSKYTCDADNDKCGFTGAEQCDTTITAVLAVDATSATFDTGAGTPASHYGSWSTCPMLQNNTFTAAAPDLLFAIDVPPKTVVDVSLVGVTGFTGNNTTGAWVEILTNCGGSGNTQAEASCKSIARAPSYANETNNPVRIYVVVDADGTNTTTGTFQVKVDSHKFACGDGVRDGSEACDDGNVRSDDGCTTACAAESGYLCTKANPSVCTRRPPTGNNTCGNVDCGAAPSGTTRCCTPDAKCGVTWELVFGAACLEVDQQGAADSECAAANSAFTFISPNIPGCCRTEDHMCGLQNGNGVGCMKRSEVWTAMQDGIGRFLYTASAFTDKSCTP